MHDIILGVFTLIRMIYQTSALDEYEHIQHQKRHSGCHHWKQEYGLYRYILGAEKTLKEFYTKVEIISIREFVLNMTE